MAVDPLFSAQDPNHPVQGAYAQPGPGITEQVVTIADKTGVAAFGPAGTASAAVLSVQGIAGGTALPVSGTGLGGGVAQGSTTAGELGTLVQGATTTTAPTYTTAQTNPLSLTTAGSLRTVDNATVAQASTTAGQVGPLGQGAVTTAAPTYVTGQTDPLSLDTAGSLRVVSNTAQASTTSGQTGGLVMGAVTTAAPTYVTAQTDPISLTTTGDVRVTAKRFRDAQVTAQVAATAAAPGAGATVATVTPGTAGLWEVYGTISVAGTTVGTADSANMRLRQTATTVLANIPLTVQATTGTDESAVYGPVILNLSAVDTVNIIAVGAATAGSIYQAMIICRQVA